MRSACPRAAAARSPAYVYLGSPAEARAPFTAAKMSPSFGPASAAVGSATTAAEPVTRRATKTAARYKREREGRTRSTKDHHFHSRHYLGVSGLGLWP